MKFIKKLNEGLGSFPNGFEKNNNDQFVKDFETYLDNNLDVDELSEKDVLQLQNIINSDEYSNDNLEDIPNNVISNILKTRLASFGYTKASELKKISGNKIKPIKGALKRETTSLDAFNNLIQSQIKTWDRDNLTQKFSKTLENHIIEVGWDAKDSFLKWLSNTDNKNIEALDDKSAKILIDFFEKTKKISTPKGDDRYTFISVDNHPYLLNDNGLFSGSANDIYFKLNVLSMLGDPSIRDNYVKVNLNGDALYKIEVGGKQIIDDQIPIIDENGASGTFKFDINDYITIEKIKNPKYEPGSDDPKKKDKLIDSYIIIDSKGNKTNNILDIDKISKSNKNINIIAITPSFNDIMDGDKFKNIDDIRSILDNFEEISVSDKNIGAEKKKQEKSKITLIGYISKLTNFDNKNLLPKNIANDPPKKYDTIIQNNFKNYLISYYTKKLNYKADKANIQAKKDIIKLKSLLDKSSDNRVKFWGWGMANTNDPVISIGTALHSALYGNNKLK